MQGRMPLSVEVTELRCLFRRLDDAFDHSGSVLGWAVSDLLRRRWARGDGVYPSEEIALGHDPHQLTTIDDG